MRLTLHTDREVYAPGEPVRLRLDVENDTDQPVRLQFPSAKRYDFEVLWEDQIIWRWSSDRLFAQVITEETLPAGEQRRFEAMWNGRLSNGEAARPGEFLGRGHLTVTGRVEPMAEQAFTVSW